MERFTTASGDMVKEIYHKHAAMLFRQSRRIRHDDRKEKKQQYYEENIATCPSCGANFMPDENNNCSYCGYGLQVYNGKWKVVNG